MTELLNLFNELKFEGKIEIHSESCYSGKLCYKAKEYYEERASNNK